MKWLFLNAVIALNTFIYLDIKRTEPQAVEQIPSIVTQIADSAIVGFFVMSILALALAVYIDIWEWLEGGEDS